MKLHEALAANQTLANERPPNWETSESYENFRFSIHLMSFVNNNDVFLLAS